MLRHPKCNRKRAKYGSSCNKNKISTMKKINICALQVYIQVTGSARGGENFINRCKPEMIAKSYNLVICWKTYEVVLIVSHQWVVPSFIHFLLCYFVFYWKQKGFFWIQHLWWKFGNFFLRGPAVRNLDLLIHISFMLVTFMMCLHRNYTVRRYCNYRNYTVRTLNVAFNVLVSHASVTSIRLH